MGFVANIRRDVRFARGLFRLLKRIKPIQLDSDVLLCDDFEEAVDKFSDNIAIDDGQRTLTYRDLDAMANRFAHWAKNRGLRRSDTIALMMTNRIEYLAAWIGFSKVGIATALINTNLNGQGLAHCLAISKAFNVVADEDCWRQIEEARPLVDHTLALWVLGMADDLETSDRRGLDKPVRGGSSVRPSKLAREGLTNRDTALYIYTSGTTGLPKAARIPHSRARTYMRAFAGATRSTPEDRIFNVLPLYHSTGGLVGVGAALLNGARLVIRKKFSATSFWPDVRASGATMFVYIGELCRYLVNCPPQEDETKHKLRLAFGNGLRADVWPDFPEAVPHSRNPGVLRLDRRQCVAVQLRRQTGRHRPRAQLSEIPDQHSVGRVRRGHRTTDPRVRRLCRQARVGEVGEAIGLIGNDIRHDFSGYADKAASQKKILTDVFKKGDRWFRTGDLMKQDAEGYFYFVDRMGDTFRWKGENVSTSEVEQVLMDAPGVAEAIVYGVPVPAQDGKAGMAALVVDGKFDAQAFSDHVEAKLPAYAQPVFLRLIKSAETTGTFKYRKADLVADGFDPEKTGSALYVRGGKSGYQKLTAAARAAILKGEGRL